MDERIMNIPENKTPREVALDLIERHRKIPNIVLRVILPQIQREIAIKSTLIQIEHIQEISPMPVSPTKRNIEFRDFYNEVYDVLLEEEKINKK